MLEDNVEKMSVLPRLIHKLNIIPIKIPASPFFYCLYRQIDSKNLYENAKELKQLKQF